MVRSVVAFSATAQRPHSSGKAFPFPALNASRFFPESHNTTRRKPALGRPAVKPVKDLWPGGRPRQGTPLPFKEKENLTAGQPKGSQARIAHGRRSGGSELSLPPGTLYSLLDTQNRENKTGHGRRVYEPCLAEYGPSGNRLPGGS